MKKNGIIWGVIILVVVIGLFAWPKFSNPARADIKRWRAADIDCIAGHTNLAQHFHPAIVIVVDGEQELIPANAGNVRGCMAEIHTHDSTGRIHVETALVGKEMRLGQLFVILGKPLEREEFSVEMTVDEEISTEFADLVLQDGQQILLEYTSL